MGEDALRRFCFLRRKPGGHQLHPRWGERAKEGVQPPPSHPARHLLTPWWEARDRDTDNQPQNIFSNGNSHQPAAYTYHPCRKAYKGTEILMVSHHNPSLYFSCCWVRAQAQCPGSICTGSDGCGTDWGCHHPGMAPSLCPLQAPMSSLLPPQSRELVQRGQPALKPNSAFLLILLQSAKSGHWLCQAAVVSVDCVCGRALGIPDF